MHRRHADETTEVIPQALPPIPVESSERPIEAPARLIHGTEEFEVHDIPPENGLQVPSSRHGTPLSNDRQRARRSTDLDQSLISSPQSYHLSTSQLQTHVLENFETSDGDRLTFENLLPVNPTRRDAANLFAALLGKFEKLSLFYFCLDMFVCLSVCLEDNLKKGE